MLTWRLENPGGQLQCQVRSGSDLSSEYWGDVFLVRKTGERMGSFNEACQSLCD